MYEINFVAQALEGLKDAEGGRLMTTEELLNRVEQWAKLQDCL
jgi:predicted transcriptional regulator